MKEVMKLTISVCVVLLVSIAGLTTAQETASPAGKLVAFQMALLKRGPQWSSEKTPERNELLAQHLAYFTSLVDSGKADLGVPLTGAGHIRGLYILLAKSAGEAPVWA